MKRFEINQEQTHRLKEIRELLTARLGGEVDVKFPVVNFTSCGSQCYSLCAGSCVNGCYNSCTGHCSITCWGECMSSCNFHCKQNTVA